MGLFYSVPADLKELETQVKTLLQFMAGVGVSTPPGLLEELLPEVSAALVAEMARLRTEGRGDEVRQYKKHLMKVAGFMDNSHYNNVFYPWIKNLI